MKVTVFAGLIIMLLTMSLGMTPGCTEPGTAPALTPTPAPAPVPEPEVIHLNMGSTSSVSGLYAWCVAGARAMNKANPGIRVTVVESGGFLLF